MEGLFNIVWGFIPETWYGVVAMVVTIATAVTMFLNTKSDNPIIDKVLAILNFAAGNIAKNKNADDK